MTAFLAICAIISFNAGVLTVAALLYDLITRWQ